MSQYCVYLSEYGQGPIAFLEGDDDIVKEYIKERFGRNMGLCEVKPKKITKEDMEKYLETKVKLKQMRATVQALELEIKNLEKVT